MSKFFNLDGFFFMAVSNDAILGRLQESVTSGADIIIDLVKMLFNNAIIPLALLAVIVYIFFLIASIVYNKRKRDGEGLEDAIKNLMIALGVFVLLSAYSSIAWGLI